MILGHICSSVYAIDKTVYLDRYGGAEGNAIYQIYAKKMPYELQELIKDPQCSFEDVVKYAAKVRGKIAEATHTLDAGLFDFLHIEDRDPLAVGRYEVPYKYPCMKRLLAMFE
jgi:hypothetical protein